MRWLLAGAATLVALFAAWCAVDRIDASWGIEDEAANQEQWDR